MKKLIFQSVLMMSVAVASHAAPAAPTKEAGPAATTKLDAEFDSLGGNTILLDKARALQPDKKVGIVQNRTVPLDRRFEFAPEFAGTFGGDAFNRTKNLGLNAYYHINSSWAVGAHYGYSFNDLTPEGRAMVDRAEADYRRDTVTPDQPYPYVDYQKSEAMAMVSYSPIYGKLNLIDKAVAHFDWYFTGGYGQVSLRSGTVPSYTGGTGIAFWMSQHFSTRLEMRYQNYKANYFSQEKNMDLAVASVQLGWLL